MAALRHNKREGATNLGLFVQDQLDFGKCTVTLGLRNDIITYDYQSFITPKLDASKRFNGLIPKLGVSYRLGEHHSVYASMGGGIEVPAGNETDPAGTFGQDTVTTINPLLDPVRSTTFEVGTKHALGAFSLGPIGLSGFDYDLAAYYIDVSNEIVPYRGGRFYFTAGKARRMGVEFGARARTTFGLTLAGAATISDNTYTEYAVDSVHYGRPGFFARCNGNRIVGVPRWMGNLQADYAIPGSTALSAGARDRDVALAREVARAQREVPDGVARHADRVGVIHGIAARGLDAEARSASRTSSMRSMRRAATSTPTWSVACRSISKAGCRARSSSRSSCGASRHRATERHGAPARRSRAGAPCV